MPTLIDISLTFSHRWLNYFEFKWASWFHIGDWLTNCNINFFSDLWDVLSLDGDSDEISDFKSHERKPLMTVT